MHTTILQFVEGDIVITTNGDTTSVEVGTADLSERNAEPVGLKPTSLEAESQNWLNYHPQALSMISPDRNFGLSNEQLACVLQLATHIVLSLHTYMDTRKILSIIIADYINHVLHMDECVVLVTDVAPECWPLPELEQLATPAPASAEELILDEPEPTKPPKPETRKLKAKRKKAKRKKPRIVPVVRDNDIDDNEFDDDEFDDDKFDC